MNRHTTTNGNKGTLNLPALTMCDAQARPHLLVRARKHRALKSLDEVRDAIRAGRPAGLWRELVAKVDRESAQAPWTPTTPLPQRKEKDIRRGNRDNMLVVSTCNRILDAAFAALVLDERRYAEAALAQCDALFDQGQWPEMEDITHLREGDHCSLRRGLFARAIGLAYDWLHTLLTDTERRRLVEGFDARFTRAFRAALDAPDRWVNPSIRNNFIVCIYGGFGVAGMGFGGDYKASAWLAETCAAQMERYLGRVFGPEGAWNESPAYAGGAMAAIVKYLFVEWYARGGQNNPLLRHGLSDACRWYMYMTLPPGRMVGFGDPSPDMPPIADHFAAVAAALRDPLLQWFSLQYTDAMIGCYRSRAEELLFYDATLPAESPAARMPLGRAYHAQARVVCSRSSWDPVFCDSVVSAKAGRERSHGHADWGQVCIDGFGERLIVDLGSPPEYPRETRECPESGVSHYYNYQQLGHNVLVLGDNDTGGIPASIRTDDERVHPQGQTAFAEFDDARGGAWVMDLTEPYGDAVEQVRRTVVHLLPNIAVVLDDAVLTAADLIRLRWHTISPAEPDSQGNFTVLGRKASLAGRIARLDGPAELSAGRHAYRAPYHTDGGGEPYQQRHEPFIQLRATAARCRVLSLFAVFGPGEEPRRWQHTDDRWRIKTRAGEVTVSSDDRDLCVSRDGNTMWRVKTSK